MLVVFLFVVCHHCSHNFLGWIKKVHHYWFGRKLSWIKSLSTSMLSVSRFFRAYSLLFVQMSGFWWRNSGRFFVAGCGMTKLRVSRKLRYHDLDTVSWRVASRLCYFGKVPRNTEIAYFGTFLKLILGTWTGNFTVHGTVCVLRDFYTDHQYVMIWYSIAVQRVLWWNERLVVLLWWWVIVDVSTAKRVNCN